MAVKPSNAALTALRNNRREKQNELVGAYTAMGGSDTALLAKPTIPKLESAIDNLYQTAQSGGRSTYNDLQAMTPAYNEYRNQRTANTLSRLGQTNTARGQNAITLEMAKDGGVMSGLVNSLALNDNVRNLLTSVTGSNASSNAFKAVQDELMKGTLTDEMRAAGLTQEDIDRWNRQQNDIERQQIASDYARNHPILATVNSFPENIAGSAEGTIEKLTNYIQGKPLESSPINAQLYRNAVGEGINSKVGNFAYGVGTSMGDMALAQLVGAGAAPALMGVEKANEVMNGAIDRGLTPNQIMAEGIGSGVTTALTERIPFSQARAGGHIGRAALAEGLQEGSENIADTILDLLVTEAGGNPEKAELMMRYQAYLNMGMSEEEASKAAVLDFYKQVGLDSLAGAFAGGGFGAINNISSGRNFITGLPRVNAETNTENNAEADTETIPVLRDSRAEEAEIESRRANEMAQLAEAYAQIQQNNANATQNNPNVAQQNAQPVNEQAVPRLRSEVENAQNNARGIVDNFIHDLEAGNIVEPMNGYADVLAELTEIGQNYPELRSTLNEELARMNQAMNGENVQRTSEAQPMEVEQPTIPSLTNRQLAQYTRQVEGLIDKLGMFGNKSFNKSLNNALKAVQNTQGEEQQNAIASLNNLVNQIDEQMAGSEVGVNQRTINQDMYDDMKRVTDGYVVKVNDNMLDEIGLTLKQLNDRVNTTARDGVNHIRFVKGNTGTAIDSIYNELYEQSNYQLPDPRSMAEGDMLKAVYNYVTDAKAGKNEMAQTATWEDVPVIDNRTKTEIDMENQTNAILEKIAEGTVTEEDYNAFEQLYNDIYWNNYDKPYINSIIDMDQEVKQAYTDYIQKSTLDEDIADLQTAEDINNSVANELRGIRMNLEFHGNSGTNTNADTTSNEEYGRVETGRTKTSEAFTNTGKKVLTKTEQRLVKQDGSMEYEENSEKESMQAATDRIIENGIVNETERLLNKTEDFHNVDVDELFKLRRTYVEEALDLEARGMDAKEAWDKAKQCFEKLQDMATSHAIGLQAYAKWSRNNTADGLLHQVTQVVNRFHNGERLGVRSRREMKQSDFQTQLEKMDNVQLTDEFVEEFTRIARQIEDMAENGIDTTVDPRALEPMNRLGQMIDSLIPASIPERVKTYLTLNMLGNPRTLLSRNFLGNVGFNVLEDFARRPISYLIDQGLSRVTGRQTIARPTAAIYNAGREGFVYGLTRSVQDLRENVHSARSGENTLQNATVNNRRSFTGPIMGMYERLVNFGLDVGDRAFYEKTYRMAIEEGNQLYEQGAIKDSNGKVLSRADFEEMNKLHAMQAALEAVYQNDTQLSDALLGFRENIGNLSRDMFGVDILSQFSMPFVKTPANIIHSFIEYSPLGLIKNAVQTIREVNQRDVNGNRVGWREGLNQERLSKELARNIIGSSMFFIFMSMARAGVMTGGYDDDNAVAQAQRESGMQEYALHTGNGDYDVSWIPVLGNNMYSAAAVYDAIKDPNLSTGAALTKGLSAGIGSAFSSSMLQGLQRLFGANGYSNGGTIADNMLDTVLSGTSQVVPSLFRQVSAVADPYQRNSYGPGFFDKYINSLRASLPWARQDLQPRVGLTGEYRQQNPGENLVEKIFSNMISPATHTTGTPDAVRDEAMRLYESTGNTIAFQPYLNQTDWKNTAGELPDAETLRAYQENAYKAMNQAATQMINSDFYASLTDGEKEATLAQIYTAINSVERANLLGSDKSNLSGAAKAYDEGGIDALVDFATAQRALAALNITNNEDNREAVLNSLGSNGGNLPALQSQYQSATGTTMTGLDDIMTGQYKDMLEMLSDESLNNLRFDLNSVVNGVEFNSMTGLDKDYDGAKAAYAEGGVNGLAEYLFPASILKEHGMTNNEKNRAMILDAYNEGGAGAVQQIVQASQALGNDSNLTYKYEHATNYIPSLTPSQFQTTWNTINTDGNTSIKIDEMIDYLNRDPDAYTSETALQYWNAFYTGTSEKIPVLVNGQWQAKKA